jgi:rubrerythrin
MEKVVSDPVSRRKFVALTGGSAAPGAFLAACGGGSTTGTTSTTTEEKTGGGAGGSEIEQFGTGDVGIVNFALTLEYLESTFYAEAKKRAGAKGELKQLIALIGKDERQHVEALAGTVKKLGGKPVKEPKFNFEYSDTAGFLELAKTFEDSGVGAYNGAAPMIKSKEVLEAAGAIVQVEARHAAAIRLQNGEEPAPGAFDAPLPEAQVLKAVEPFIA